MGTARLLGLHQAHRRSLIPMNLSYYCHYRQAEQESPALHHSPDTGFMALLEIMLSPTWLPEQTPAAKMWTRMWRDCPLQVLQSTVNSEEV